MGLDYLFSHPLAGEAEGMLRVALTSVLSQREEAKKQKK